MRFAAIVGTSLCVFALGTGAAEAQTRTWTGGAAGNDAWGQAGNWLEGAFVDGADVIFYNPGAAQLNPNSLNNGTPNTFRSAHSITFNANSTTSVLIDSGEANNVLRINPTSAGDTALSVAAAAAAHTITAQVRLDKSQVWNIAGGAGNFTVSVIGQAAAGTSLTKDGGGTLRINGASTYTGGTILSAGTLRADNTLAFGPAGSAVTLNGGTLLLAGGGADADHTYNLNVAGTAILRSVGARKDLVGSLTGAGTLTVDATSDSIRMEGNMGGFTGTLIKSNPGELHLMVDNGAFGTAATTSGSASAEFQVNSGKVFLLNNNQAGTAFMGSLSGTGGTIHSKFNRSGNVTLEVGALGLSTTYSGVIADGDTGPTITSLTKVGSGTLTLSGANTYDGATNIDAGILVVNNNTALGATAGDTTVASGAQLRITLGRTLGAGEQITIAGAGTGGSVGAIRSQSGANIIQGNVVLTGSATLFANTGSSLTINGTITGFVAGGPVRTVTLDGPGTGALNGDIAAGAGQGAIVKNGTGTWTLAGTGNNWTVGGTTINNGTLVLGAADVVPNGAGYGNVVINALGILDARFNETINGLSGTGTLDKTAGAASTFTIGGNNTTSTFAGTIQDSGANALTIAKGGTGTLTLTGTLNYAGETQTNDNGGTLIFNTGGPVNLVDELDLGDNTTFRVQSGSVVFNPSSGDAATLNNGAGTTAIVQVDAAASLEIADNFGLNNSTLNLNIDGSMLMSGPLASGGGDGGGPNTINKNGPGTLTFTNAANNAKGAYNLRNGLTEFDGSAHDNTGANGGILTVGGVAAQTATLDMLNAATYTGVDAFRVGNNGGTGILNVDGGSTITAAGPGSNIVLSRTGAGSNGTVNLINGTIHSLNGIVVGFEGTGTYIQTTGSTIADANLTLGEDSTGIGTFTLNGGTVSAGTDTLVGNAGTGTLNVNAGTLTTPDLLVGNTATGVGTVNQMGGTINVTNSTTYSVGAGGGMATVNHTGGTTNVTGNMLIGNSAGPAAQNNYNLNGVGAVLDFGDTLTLAPTAHHQTNLMPSTLDIRSDGQFNFNSGTLLDVSTVNANNSAAGSTPAGTFHQNGTTALWEIGQQDTGPAGLTTLNGNLLQSSGTIAFDVFGYDVNNTPENTMDDMANNPIDLLIVNGDAQLGGTVDVDFFTMTPPVFGDVFPLMKITGEVTIDPTFHIDGGFFRVVEDGMGNFTLQAIVPEPGSVAMWSLLALAAGGFALRRRRG